MKRNPFTKQEKALSSEIRDIIVEKWLEGSKPFQIGLQLNLPRKTVSNTVDRFVRTGSVQPGVGENKIRTARTDDVVLYTEFCKRQRPSVYAAEVQKELIENQVVLPAKRAVSSFDKPCVDKRFGLLVQKDDNSSKRKLD